MSRTVFTGARIFDGSGSDPAPGDLAVEDGRIVDVGGGLDADESVDLAGLTILPGLFDCHVHVVLTNIDQWRILNLPFSYRFYEAAVNLRATLAAGITTVRDAGGAGPGGQRPPAGG